MNKLNQNDLLKLEDYAQQRSAFRANTMRHKKPRRVALGPNLALYFEDRLTMQYQIQEMLRVEKIFEPQEIREELDTYNALIPDGNNWKATCMIEYIDVEERKLRLTQLKGIEDLIWVQVGDQSKVYAIADEDLDRTNDTKTSAVHFLRFELDQQSQDLVNQGADISAGVDHPNYTRAVVPLAEETRASLSADLS